MNNIPNNTNPVDPIHQPLQLGTIDLSQHTLSARHGSRITSTHNSTPYDRPIQKKKLDIIKQECPICFKSLHERQIARFTCMHNFCAPCLSSWVLKQEQNEINVSCPLCRFFPSKTQISYIKKYLDEHVVDLTKEDKTPKKKIIKTPDRLTPVSRTHRETNQRNSQNLYFPSRTSGLPRQPL